MSKQFYLTHRLDPFKCYHWSLTIRLLMSYPGHVLGRGSYPSTKIQPVHSTALANGSKVVRNECHYTYLLQTSFPTNP